VIVKLSEAERARTGMELCLLRYILCNCCLCN